MNKAKGKKNVIHKKMDKVIPKCRKNYVKIRVEAIEIDFLFLNFDVFSCMTSNPTVEFS